MKSQLKPWRVLSSQVLLDKSPWLKVREQAVIMSHGNINNSFLLTEAPSHVNIFALTKDLKVPLVRQYRHGYGDVTVELPAGYLLDLTESPLAGAGRELHEETGLHSAYWKELGTFFLDVNRGRTACHAFLAKGAEHGDAEPEEIEDLNCEFHALSEVEDMVRHGSIVSMSSVVTILAALRYLESQ